LAIVLGVDDMSLLLERGLSRGVGSG
jgi:hypothetical protein